MWNRVQPDAEETRVVVDIFHYHLRVAQRVRSLQLIARIGHFGHQTAHPGVQLQFQQTPILGGADVFTLNQLQIMRDTRQQEDIRQTGVNAAVGGGIRSVIQRGFLGGIG